MKQNPFSTDDGQSTSHTRTTAHEFVREQIRRAVLNGSLPAGSRLVQSEIADQLGVSTTPVREALRDLATEGLVEFDSFRGAVVHEPTRSEVEEVYELRAVLEPIAIRRAIAEIGDAQLRKAELLMEKMEAETDPGVWVDLNRSFHEILLEPGAYRRLDGILRNLSQAASAYVALSLNLGPERMTEANDDHRELLDAYRKREADRAVEIATRHLAATVDVISSALSTQEGRNA